MTNVVKFNQAPTMGDALAVVDTLRKDVEEGRIVAFFVAGLDSEDATFAYVAAVKPVSKLRLEGAMCHALYCLQSGEAEL